MKKFAVLCLCMAGITAFAGRVEILKQPEVVFDRNHSLGDVNKAIKKALIGRSWEITDQRNGEINAVLRVRSHKAVIRISYDREGMKIWYVNSSNLLYREKRGIRYIHRNYYRWIRNVQADILAHLQEY